MKLNNYFNVGTERLFRFVIAILLMLLMIFSVIKLYLANQPTVESVNYTMQKQNFSNTLSLIRGQWLLEGRPSAIKFSFHDNDENVINTTAFNLSKLGWASIDGDEQPHYCRSLWAAIINAVPRETEQNTFIVAKSKKSDDNVCQICDAKQRQVCFEYSTETGIAYPVNSN